MRARKTVVRSKFPVQMTSIAEQTNPGLIYEVRMGPVYDGGADLSRIVSSHTLVQSHVSHVTDEVSTPRKIKGLFGRFSQIIFASAYVRLRHHMCTFRYLWVETTQCIYI